MDHDDGGNGPDLQSGVPVATIPESGLLAGHVGEAKVVLVRRGDELFAVGGDCTHYGGQLKDGLVAGETLRCPLHHACFSLRTGEAIGAPAFDPIPCWRVERVGDTVRVREKLEQPKPVPPAGADAPKAIVVIGGGAAGFAAAEMLRREGYAGSLTIVSADTASPCDRPNLSKDYLAGDAPEEWIPLKPEDFYAERGIELLLDERVTSIDTAAHTVQLESGRQIAWDRLLLATGAEPVRLDIPGASASQIHYLRSLADSRALIAKAEGAKRAIVVGASFIGLEVAASLRKRGLEVDVVAHGSLPMEHVFGAEVGAFVKALHESQGVRFHMGRSIAKLDGVRATLDDGTMLEADFIVAGVGVKPNVALAEKAGLALDRGVVVDAFLQTSAPGIYAAGDIARWPDPHTGEPIRVEHWVVAERQGQHAALNMLGRQKKFEDVPFFWSQHYDISFRYVGHAEHWDAIALDGSLAAQDCAVAYRRDGRTLAVLTLGRDAASLEAEFALEAERRAG
jgi:NADPH-dependent 2,4-dienoyl-CoA reductase/sulfur reductase-like enzyme/nitrite reductase/ring-hydroxylating ferredoxin subunit